MYSLYVMEDLTDLRIDCHFVTLCVLYESYIVLYYRIILYDKCMMCGKSFLLEIHVGRHINFEIDLQNLAFCQ